MSMEIFLSIVMLGAIYLIVEGAWNLKANLRRPENQRRECNFCIIFRIFIGSMTFLLLLVILLDMISKN